MRYKLMLCLLVLAPYSNALSFDMSLLGWPIFGHAGFITTPTPANDGSITITSPEFEENFESGAGDWYASQGAWEVDAVENETILDLIGAEYAGQGLLATGVNSFYEPDQYSRFISPELLLPMPSGEEELRLIFQHWFKNGEGDYGVVQVSVDGESWETVSDTLRGDAGVWSQYIADLSAYAGQRIQIGFLFSSDLSTSCGSTGCQFTTTAGWYINELRIESGPVQVSMANDFESGAGDWYASQGAWEVDAVENETILKMIGAEYAGQGLLATGVNSFYRPNQESHFISPAFLLPMPSSEEELRLIFQHWFKNGEGDYGVVQVSVDGESWETVSDTLRGDAGVWSQYIADLSAYAGQRIQIGFLFSSDLSTSCGSTGCQFTTTAGWYINELRIESGPVQVSMANDFESGAGDWYASQGAWEVDAVENETILKMIGAEYAGQGLLATGVNSFYRPNQHSRFISPAFSPVIDDSLTFDHWFKNGEGDYGVVQVLVDGGTWATISDTLKNSSGGWKQYKADLSAYAGQHIRIGFLFSSDLSTTCGSTGCQFTTTAGWYIDNIDLPIEVFNVSGEEVEAPAPLFELNSPYPNPFKTTTNIGIAVHQHARITFYVYDSLGREVHKAAIEHLDAGEVHTIVWDGSDFASGTYIYRVELTGPESKMVKSGLVTILK